MERLLKVEMLVLLHWPVLENQLTDMSRCMLCNEDDLMELLDLEFGGITAHLGRRNYYEPLV